MLLEAPDFIRRPFPVLARLVDHRRCQQLRRVEIAHRESLEPRFVPAGETVQLRPPHVPELDVDTV